jgi:hypothetical protein
MAAVDSLMPHSVPATMQASSYPFPSCNPHWTVLGPWPGHVLMLVAVWAVAGIKQQVEQCCVRQYCATAM